MQVYIDTDLGTDVDDALALALAACDPRFDLRGLSTVNGPVRERAAQVRGWLDLCGRDDVPVGVGWADPIGGANGRMPVGLVADGPVGTLPTDVPSSEEFTNIARDLAKHPAVRSHRRAACDGRRRRRRAEPGVQPQRRRRRVACGARAAAADRARRPTTSRRGCA